MEIDLLIKKMEILKKRISKMKEATKEARKLYQELARTFLASNNRVAIKKSDKYNPKYQRAMKKLDNMGYGHLGSRK